MFSKSFFIFGLLALFACQTTNAESLNSSELRNNHAKVSLNKLVKDIEEIIKSLEGLVKGVIGDAITTITNIGGDVAKIKDKFLNEGIAEITNIVGEVTKCIANKTEEAISNGVDITLCIAGRAEEVLELKAGLIRNLTAGVADAAEDVLKTVNDELVTIKQIVRNIESIPVQLSKCLINLRPIKCLERLLENTSELLKHLPGQIQDIVDKAVSLVKNLPTALASCAADITSSAIKQTGEIIDEIEKCADDIILNHTTASAPESISG